MRVKTSLIKTEYRISGFHKNSGKAPVFVETKVASSQWAALASVEGVTDIRAGEKDDGSFVAYYRGQRMEFTVRRPLPESSSRSLVGRLLTIFPLTRS